MTYPEHSEGEHLQDEQQSPGDSADDLTEPEERVVHWVHHSTFVGILEPPLLLPVLVDLAPPAQSDQQPASDVLDDPEIERAEDNDDDEGDDVGDEATHEEVEEQSCCLEAEGGDAGHGVRCLLEVELVVVGGDHLVRGFRTRLSCYLRRSNGWIRIGGPVERYSEVELVRELGHDL